MQNIQNIIKSIPIFSSFNNDDIEKLSNMSYTSRYSANTLLYYENEKIPNISFLVEGSINVYKVDNFNHEIFLYHINKSDLISDIDSLDEDEITCLANTVFSSDSLILNINFKKFKRSFLKQNSLFYHLIANLISKNKKLHNLIERELIHDAKTKVVNMILSDTETFNLMQRKEVSLHLNIQPETLSRALKSLKKQGLIMIDNSGSIKVTKDNNFLR